MLYERCAFRRAEAVAALTAPVRVLLGGMCGELDREWCVSVGGDLVMGGAVSFFRFNLYSNTCPLSAAKQQV